MCIFVVDDDPSICKVVSETLSAHWDVETYPSSEAFLECRDTTRNGCLLVDAVLPGMSGIELLRDVRTGAAPLPAIVMTGAGDIAMAVQAIRAGAVDFVEKPIGADGLMASIERALAPAHGTGESARSRDAAGVQG